MAKILLEIVADQSNVGVALEELRSKVKLLNKELASQPGQARSRELREELVKTKTEIQKTTEAQKALNREFKAAQLPKDSLAGLRLEYSKLNDQITKLSAAERNSPIGKGLVQNAGALKTQINGIEESIGRFTGSVGNYRKGLLQVGDVISGGLVTGGIVAGVTAVVAIMKVGIQQALDYEQALADLSAITGVTGSALKGLENVATGLRTITVNGTDIVSTGPEILKALKLVGSAQPELLKSASALGEVTRNAIILSKSSGDDLATSVTAITTILGQFNLEASESGRIINELAAGSKLGSVEVPGLTEALSKFGATANLVGVTTRESIALVEVLGKAKIPQDQIGVPLRNILTFLAAAESLPPKAQAAFAKFGVSAEVLADKTKPLAERLAELQKLDGNIPALKAIFGSENLNAAAVLSTNVKLLEELTAGVKGTSDALDQAAIRAGTTNQALINLKNGALNGLGDFFGTVTKGANRFVQALADISEGAASGSLARQNELDPEGAAQRRKAQALALSQQKQMQEAFTGTAFTADLARRSFNGLFGEVFNVTDATKGLNTATSDQVREQQLLALSLGESGATIAQLTARIKNLKREIAGEATGSDRFKELAVQLKEAQKQLRLAKSEAGITGPGRGTKQEADAAAGSIDFLQKEISNLQTQLNATPQSSKQFELLIQQLEDAEKALADLKRGIEEIRNPTARAIPTAQDIRAGLGLELGDLGKEDFLNSQDNRAAIVEATNDFIQRDTEETIAAIDDAQVAANMKADADADAARAKRIQDQDDFRKLVKEQAIEAAGAIANGLLQIEGNRLNEQTNEALTALDAEYEKKIELAQGNVLLIEKLQKEQEAKRSAIEKKAAKERQQIALKEAAINTALAIIKAFTVLPPASFILAAAAAVAGAVQIAAIKSQSFAGGGFYKNMSQGGQTGRSSQGADHTGARPTGLAMLHEGEFVANARQVRQFPHLFSFLESDRLRNPRYLATGGFASNPPQIALPSGSGSSGAIVVQTQATISEETMLAFAQQVAKETADKVFNAVAEGQGDATRRLERQGQLADSRGV